MHQLESISVDPMCALSTWGPHVVVVWFQTPDVSHAQLVADTTARAARAAPGRACHIAWVTPEVGVLGAQARSVFVQMGRTLGKDLCAMLAVVGDDGFASAAFRAIIAGIAMAARIDFPLKLAGNVEEGARWLAERPAGVDPSDVLRVLRELYESRPALGVTG